MSSTKGSFLLELIEGYTLRNFIDYLKSTNTKNANIKFTNNLVSLVQSNATFVILNDFQIKTYLLPRYEFKCDSGQIIIGIEIEEFKLITKKIGRKEGLRITKNEDENHITIEILCNNRDSGNPNYIIKNRYFDPYNFSSPVFPNDNKENRNITSSVTEFTRICGVLSSYNNTVIVQTFPKGIVFKIETELEQSLCIQSLGEIHENDVEINTLCIDQKIIKALSKINNLCPSGALIFYFEKNKPILLTCKVGYFAKLKISIKSLAKEESDLHASYE